MTRIWTMSRVTFREAVRKKLVFMALLAGLAFLLLFAIGLHFQLDAFEHPYVRPFVRKQVLSDVLMMGIYAINLLVVVLTVLVSVDTLSGEIASGAIQAIASKPVRRSEVLIGKWLGLSGMLTVYILLMVFGINGLSRLMAGVVVRHMAQGLSLMWLESMLLLSVTICFGTSFSTLTNGVLTLGLHGLAFLGGWMEQAGALTKTPKAVMAGIVASVLMPSEALWRRAAFEMQAPIATAVNFAPFSGASVPSALMIAYAALYTTAFLLVALLRFHSRDL